VDGIPSDPDGLGERVRARYDEVVTGSIEGGERQSLEREEPPMVGAGAGYATQPCLPRPLRDTVMVADSGSNDTDYEIGLGKHLEHLLQTPLGPCPRH